MNERRPRPPKWFQIVYLVAAVGAVIGVAGWVLFLSHQPPEVKVIVVPVIVVVALWNLRRALPWFASQD